MQPASINRRTYPRYRGHPYRAAVFALRRAPLASPRVASHSYKPFGTAAYRVCARHRLFDSIRHGESSSHPRKRRLHRHDARRRDGRRAEKQPLVHDVRPRVLRGRDDARGGRALRHGPLRHDPARVAAPVRSDDRRRHADQQDGARDAPRLRPDGRTALRRVDGLVRERRRLLPLQLFGRARLRSHRARRRLRTRLPADRRGARLRSDATAAQGRRAQHA
ncbi:NADH dehydrogenase subunit B [Burkholderia pseudomallei MSHR1043]|nr:NADH dehydrogenase subunit B [Burkholderia pseudomallei MSHR1043]